MNPLPPLPFVDGHFLIDNSTIEKLKCPRLLELEWLRKRVLVASKAGRNFGSGMHCGWATRYRQCGREAVTPEAVPIIYDSIRQWFDAHPQPLNDFRDFNHACKVMDCYNGYYDREPFELALSPKTGQAIVEHPFMHPFDTIQGYPVWLTGRVDLVALQDGLIWNYDHKTAFMFGKGWEADMTANQGQRGYVWYLQQIFPERKVEGYVIDGVRIRRPKKEDEYSGGAPVDSSDLLRIPVHLSDDNIAEWRENTTRLIGSIFDMHKAGYFPRYNWQCSGKYGLCDMHEVCFVERESRQARLDSTAFEENTWNPLNRPTDD